MLVLWTKRLENEGRPGARGENSPQINDLTNMTTITMFTKFYKKEPNYG